VVATATFIEADQSRRVGALYAEHHGWLHGLLRKKLGCAHRAEDLAQDTFLKLLVSHAATVLHEPRAFLTTIANGLVVNHWRRLEVERAYAAALEVHGAALSPSPEERALAVEALCRIDALLAGLPAKVGHAFVLSHIEGLTYLEIAGRLGVSERMVKKYMAQAMYQLLLADA
jgi:RNA polymerase sigma factor (sigma-70 family)